MWVRDLDGVIAEHFPNKVLEHRGEVLHAHVDVIDRAVVVVEPLLLWVGQDAVRAADFLELPMCSVIVGIFVRVVLQRQPAVHALQVVLHHIPWYPQDGVQVHRRARVTCISITATRGCHD